ncbi:hypothetical protein [Spirosoma soli]|uniref:hypothetical protein n=1 Tax=Spirosoma soli TaxID=1770529 RepID=UPI0036D34D19
MRATWSADTTNIYRKVFVYTGLKRLAFPVMIGTNSLYEIKNCTDQLSETKAAARLKELFKFEAILTTKFYNRDG